MNLSVSDGLEKVPATLLGLVSTYSPTGSERDAVDWLVAHMSAAGFTQAYSDPVGNAVGVMGAGPRLGVLLGHIDTVPGWIPLRCEEGRFYGRGTVDAKGPLAAFVDAAARLGPVPGWQLVVIGAVDEEGSSRGARAILDSYRPEFVLVGEPSGWDRLTLGYKGSVWFRVVIKRGTAHSASGQESAPEAAYTAWSAVLQWAQMFNAERLRAFDQVLVTLRGMASGSNGVEDWASLEIGLRLPPGLDPQSAICQMQTQMGEVEIHPLGSPIPAYRGEKNNPLVRAMLAGIRATGGSPGFVLKTGTADLNLAAPAWSCPGVAYGPGDSALDHTATEHIHLDEYQRSVEVLDSALRMLCCR